MSLAYCDLCGFAHEDVGHCHDCCALRDAGVTRPSGIANAVRLLHEIVDQAGVNDAPAPSDGQASYMWGVAIGTASSALNALGVKR